MAGRKRKETSNDQQSSFVGMERRPAPPIENPNLLANGKKRSKRRANGALDAWHKPHVTKHEKRIALRGWKIFELINHDQDSSRLRPPPRDHSITIMGDSQQKTERGKVFRDYIFPQPGDEVNWEGLRKLAQMAREILKKK